MLEVGGLDRETAIEALKQSSYKFSIDTKVVARLDVREQREQVEQPEATGEQA